MPALTVYYAAMSLDGYIAEPEEKLEWLTRYEGRGYAGAGASDVESSYPDFIADVGAVAMGSKTYEFILEEPWSFEELPTWVLTSRELPAVADAVDLRFTSGDVSDLHPELVESAGGGHLWVVGGGVLASQFLAAGLLDRVTITIVPTVLGAGLPLFAEPVPPLRLLGMRPFDNGMAELSYEVVR